MSSSPGGEAFEPHAILAALQAERVQFVLVGALARVLQGSDEVTDGLDLTPSLRPANVGTLEVALGRLGAAPRGKATLARAVDTPESQPVVAFKSPHGPLNVVVRPAGTRGYEDLRRKAALLHLGEGIRAYVASPGDLVRMLEARGEAEREATIEAMRRIVELDRGLGLEMDG